MQEANPIRRLWLLRAMSILLGLLPFAALEIYLRVGSPSVREAWDTDPWVDLHQLEPLFEKNLASDRWEIPDTRHNFFCPDSFPNSKTANTRRIFVLGGSTVQGRPYATETAFSTWLEFQLEAADSTTEYEVINCGGVSYASYRVARILQEVVHYQPDAIVLYTGHNEFLEDREYSSVRELGTLRQSLIPLARYSHIASWLNSKFTNPPQSNNAMPREVLTRLDQENGLQKYERDTEWRRGVERHFETTLQQMIECISESGIPLLLCVPVSDIVGTPPFKSRSDPSLSDEKERDIQSAWLKAQDLQHSDEVRLAAAKECLLLDQYHAGANYLCGKILFDRGLTELAQPYLIRARDHDVCPLRATSSVISAIKRHANHELVYLVDVPKHLDKKNQKGLNIPDGIVDPEWFIDHVHPSIKGHQVIAQACFETMKSLPWVQGDAPTSTYEARVNQHLSNLDETYFARGKQRLEGLQRWSRGRAKSPLIENNH